MALVATTVFLTFVTGIVIFVYRCAAFRDKFIIVGNCPLAVVDGNTPLRLSTFRLLQVCLVYYAFYNFACYNFAWNVIVRHLVYPN